MITPPSPEPCQGGLPESDSVLSAKDSIISGCGGGGSSGSEVGNVVQGKDLAAVLRKYAKVSCRFDCIVSVCMVNVSNCMGRNRRLVFVSILQVVLLHDHHITTHHDT